LCRSGIYSTGLTRFTGFNERDRRVAWFAWRVIVGINDDWFGQSRMDHCR
jgi:hypothetical protein